MTIRIVKKPFNESANSHYGGNMPPLVPGFLCRLPPGSIMPRGWLKHQVELMAKGMTGRLKELSHYIDRDNGWLGGGKEGWEEQPYWLRGFYSLAVLSGDKELMHEAQSWIEHVLGSQDEDGYFGPVNCKCVTGENGHRVCDLWPHMIMIDALILHHEYTGDSRIIPFLIRFFEFCRKLPEDRFVPPYEEGYGDWKPFVQHARSGDMLPHIYWLYNRTGHEWLPGLATRFYKHTAPPSDEWLDHHIVHFTQRFRYPGSYYTQTGEKWYLDSSEYWYRQHMLTWGQQPRGVFAADELIRSKYTDPRQGFETCGMVEFAKSFYILGRITGDTVYADRTEDILFNHFTAAQTPDLKALHYLTASNQPQLDASEQHEYTNRGKQINYSPGEVYRCCQHNVSMGWPWYVENLWAATPDNGIAAWMHAPSEVRAKVGRNGDHVVIKCNTHYPFSGKVVLKIECPDNTDFPLYLRIPGWCTGYSISMNGRNLDVPGGNPGEYVCMIETFSNNDVIEFDMHMDTRVHRWPRNGSATIDRGPLSYSLKIAEKWVQSGGTDLWPEWEVFPDSPWNYGIIVNNTDSCTGLKVIEKDSIPDQPWTVENAPVEIKVPGKRIKDWGMENETVEELKVSPVSSDAPADEITLIPMGCARLRISCFPVIGEGDDMPDWRSAPAAHL